ncbi:hypothetical protein MLD38_029322 [Melastoma candidum]|uniref:Uncharacterized protein n=1 Tax=Melastoma candidum TaxID=119954 RepID=A0ACB9N605_9MYRT|nr:hypothetical protein MLD38_029322 [Melastoma candidum]
MSRSTLLHRVFCSKDQEKKRLPPNFLGGLWSFWIDLHLLLLLLAEGFPASRLQVLISEEFDNWESDSTENEPKAHCMVILKGRILKVLKRRRPYTYSHGQKPHQTYLVVS